MFVAATFDPTVPAGGGSFNTELPGGRGRMLVINDSSVNLYLQWADAFTYLPAGQARLYRINVGNAVINWTRQSFLGGPSPVVSQVIVETYEDREEIVERFPSHLGRQTNIGNAVNLAVSATSIANDGNVANTSVVEATVSGDANGSAVNLTNNGHLTLGTATAGNQGTLQLNGIVGPLVKLDPGGLTLQESGTAIHHDSGIANSTILEAKVAGDTNSSVNLNNNGNLILGGGRNGSVQVNNNANANSAKMDTTGFTLQGASAKYNFPHGTISDLYMTSGIGIQTVTHNVGVPDCIQVSALANPAVAVSVSNVSATQLQVNAGVGIGWYLLVLKA